jgi:two-component system LytT family response regulator
VIAPPVRTLVVDDEPLARRALRALIDETDWLEWIGEAEDGPTAARLIGVERPELVFMDVELPGLSGIEVLSAANSTTMVVIFTTAYEEYALTAFELGAIDYLVKPFGRQRLERAIARAVPQLEAVRAGGGRSLAADSTFEDRVRLARGGRLPLTELFVRDRGSVIRVPLADVTRFEADDDYVAVYASGRRYLVHVTLSDLADRLDPGAFVRIHRSHIVQLSHVQSMAPVDPNRVAVRLADGSRVVASRTGTRALRGRVRGL